MIIKASAALRNGYTEISEMAKKTKTKTKQLVDLICLFPQH